VCVFVCVHAHVGAGML